MACNCTGSISECIKAYVNPCDLGVSTGIIAPVSGDYLVILEGYQTAVRYTIEVNEGDEIVLLNNINNNYTYQLQIFKPNGDLLNDTCYTLKTIITLDSSSAVTPSPVINTRDCSIEVIIVDSPDSSVLYTLCNGDKIQYEYAAGNTLQILDEDGNPFLPGLYVQMPVFLDNTVIQDIDYNSTLGTFDNSVNGGFNVGSKFTCQYAQPI